MKKYQIAIVLLAVMTGVAGAGLYQYDLSVSDLKSASEITATDPFGWDWDEDAPIESVAGGGAPGYGNSAWYSDVDGSAAGTGRDYTALRIFPHNALGRTERLTVSDIDKISYFSKLVDGIDWQIKIYTAPEAGDGWFRYRLNFERGAETDLQWHQHSTDELGVPWVQDYIGGVRHNTYYSKGETLADLQATYGDEEIMWIDIIASFATESPLSNTYLDGVVLESDGDVMDVNLVPEPATMSLLALGGLALLRRKK